MARYGISPERFRVALGSYPTGVTVVTAIGPSGPSGATANAVTSLSLDPPMMLACLDRGSRTLTAVRGQGRFGVNALAAGQEELARQFSGKESEGAKWRPSDPDRERDRGRVGGWAAAPVPPGGIPRFAGGELTPGRVGSAWRS
jgi:flavin reductase (DIM6/NTAB) family NADH-FMN oxidoreductase RutF